MKCSPDIEVCSFKDKSLCEKWVSFFIRQTIHVRDIWLGLKTYFPPTRILYEHRWVNRRLSYYVLYLPVDNAAFVTYHESDWRKL